MMMLVQHLQHAQLKLMELLSYQVKGLSIRYKLQKYMTRMVSLKYEYASHLLNGK